MPQSNPRYVNLEQHQKLMQEAFNHVCDPDDWKGPIDAIVPYSTANLYMQAITFMTATVPEAERTQDAVGNPAFRLTSVGYRMGPAGDH